MAVGHLATTQGSGGPAPTFTFAHTNPAGGNYLVVTVEAYDSTGGGVFASAVTYAGVAMTFVGSQAAIPGFYSTSLWVLQNPAGGANNVVVTIGNNTTVNCGASSFEGVHLTTPKGALFTATLGGTGISVNVTDCQLDGMVVDVVGTEHDTWSHTSGAGQTQRWTTWNASGSTKPSDATTETMSRSWTNALSAAQLAIALYPAPACTNIIFF